jgi:hypothetical protein
VVPIVVGGYINYDVLHVFLTGKGFRQSFLTYLILLSHICSVNLLDVSVVNLISHISNATHIIKTCISNLVRTGEGTTCSIHSASQHVPTCRVLQVSRL